MCINMHIYMKMRMYRYTLCATKNQRVQHGGFARYHTTTLESLHSWCLSTALPSLCLCAVVRKHEGGSNERVTSECRHLD